MTYKIIKQEKLPTIGKRILAIRLNRKVSEAVLRSIALELQAAESHSYTRTFIAYYLPGMEVDAGSWAYTNFEPDLHVGVQGITIEEESLKLTDQSGSTDAIGRWNDEAGGFPRRVTLFRRSGGETFMEDRFKDGTTNTKEIVAIGPVTESRFRDADRKQADEFYVIDSQGNLEFWDQEGLVYQLPPANKDE